MRRAGALGLRRCLAREDVRQAFDVDLVENASTSRTLESHDQLGPQDVDLAVQNSSLIGDLALLRLEVVDHELELLVRERSEIWKWFQLEQTFRR
jgi:hypothetical protein